VTTPAPAFNAADETATGGTRPKLTIDFLMPVLGNYEFTAVVNLEIQCESIWINFRICPIFSLFHSDSLSVWSFIDCEIQTWERRPFQLCPRRACWRIAGFNRIEDQKASQSLLWHSLADPHLMSTFTLIWFLVTLDMVLILCLLRLSMVSGHGANPQLAIGYYNYVITSFEAVIIPPGFRYSDYKSTLPHWHQFLFS